MKGPSRCCVAVRGSADRRAGRGARNVAQRCIATSALDAAARRGDQLSSRARRPRARPPQHREASGLSHEAAALAEFKQAVADAGLVLPPEMAMAAGNYDPALRRFLRARKGKIDAALAMLQSESQKAARRAPLDKKPAAACS